MAPLVSAVAGLAILASVAMAQMTSDDMGPAAFMWPKDRVWSAALDNTAPCGSIAGASNRTLFPMQNGRLALVAQNESFDAIISISYLQDPKSNGDFATLIDAKAMRELDKGHTCVPIVDPPSSVKAGSNATLQIKYISEFDKPENETFYACADITYVALSDFKDSIPCFNATIPDTGKGSKSSPTASPKPSSGTPSSGGGSSGLSGGAIAGIVVGVIAGVGLLGAAAIFWYRRRQQQKRVLRQQNSSRAVKWDEQPRDSNSQRSVRMQNMSR
ncbi:hypothetical protein JDV02_004846 [Purpureocillium takamizusanense]|uniref:Copper acquisition factor BIM1-like domain-containing protein n=1 Tax=Purpureocillium takamizusanense TaxID=2060973 RepID=A0A9Q8VAD9_9HYPO|nr:uncharacterized protein JDV02_004846 [Purpureocillium takamizusanense]UNI18588.1 hypothetical protein JDV02_004846 [Purpureocillium takamizusanense]